MLDTVELEQMLDAMVRSDASVLHITVDRQPSLRIQDKLVRANGPAVPSDAVWALVDAVVPADQRQRLERGEDLDCLYTSRSGIRFRSTVLLDERGPNLVFRRLPAGMPSFADLGLPELLDSFVHTRSGLIVVAGFLGSGKTMTLGAMVDRINQSSASHIVTIEKPIEHVHEPASSMVHQREVGRQVADFATGVREAMRQSPDVIMVGNLPDPDTLLAALDAAERGCLVLAGLQANSVVGALERLTSTGPPVARERLVRRLSEVLRVLVSQALLQRSHGNGCVPLLEILINNGAATKAMRAGRLDQLDTIMERGRGLGMQTVDRGLKSLLSRNLITIEEALYHATDRGWVYQWGR